MTTEKPRRLGRGLEALLATTAPLSQGLETGTPTFPVSTDTSGATIIHRVPVNQIRPNPYQPRREFRPEDLSELEASLRANGLLQPITVRQIGPSQFELIVGERRFRAATNIGWTEIPAIVRAQDDVDNRTLLTLALVENLQRADLNPIEEAEGYKQLTDEFGLTQQQVADAVGKDRSTVANLLRVLSLPTPVRQMLSDRLITLGHARALLALPNDRSMIDMANEVIAMQLNVREVERRVRDVNAPRADVASTTPVGDREVARPLPSPSDQVSAELRSIEDQLRRHLQTDVHLALTGKEKGVLRISFYSSEDLERLLDLVLGTRSEFSETPREAHRKLDDLDEIIFP